MKKAEQTTAQQRVADAIADILAEPDAPELLKDHLYDYLQCVSRAMYTPELLRKWYPVACRLMAEHGVEPKAR